MCMILFHKFKDMSQALQIQHVQQRQNGLIFLFDLFIYFLLSDTQIHNYFICNADDHIL